MKADSLPYHLIIENLERFIGKGDSVLDIGCGRGDIINYFAARNRGRKHTCVDIEDKYSGNLTNVRFFKDDIRKISLKGRFDAVVMSNILEHLEDPYSILRRCKGWLKRDGKLVVIVPNQHSFHLMSKTVNSYVRRGHLWMFNDESLQFLMENLGFSQVSVNDGWFHFPFAMRLYSMVPRLAVVVSKVLSKIFSRRRGNITIVAKLA